MMLHLLAFITSYIFGISITYGTGCRWCIDISLITFMYVLYIHTDNVLKFGEIH